MFLNLGFSAQISEIFPHTFENQSEWIEVKIEAEPGIYDVANWALQKGTKTILWSENSADITGSDQITIHQTNPADMPQTGLWLEVLESPAFLVWQPSPVSLTNSGAELILLNDTAEIVDQVTYPNTKKGTRDKTPYAGFWTRVEQNLRELIHWPSRRNDASPRDINKTPPTELESTQILISEIAMKRDQDFIEIYVSQTPNDGTDLKYAQLKLNGTIIWESHDSLQVQSGDYLVFQSGPLARQQTSYGWLFESPDFEGISAGSGSVEFIYGSMTSSEARYDAICWYNQSQSQTEQNRVEGWIQALDWSGDCFDIANFVENDSLARPNLSDSNTVGDWSVHHHGSLGRQNITQNNPPIAQITVQGSGKTSDRLELYINLSAENSTDPDGDYDLVQFEWLLNGAPWLSGINPPGIRLDQTGTHLIELIVTDLVGETDRAEQHITIYPPGGSAQSSLSATDSERFVEPSVEALKALQTGSVSDSDWFGSFLAVQGDDFWEEVLIELTQTQPSKNPSRAEPIPWPQQTAPPEIKPWKYKKYMRDLVTTDPKKLRKNIGFVYWDPDAEISVGGI